MASENALAEQGYENAVWLLSALLDETMYEGAGPSRLRDEDRVGIERSESQFPIFAAAPRPFQDFAHTRARNMTDKAVINPIRTRLDNLRRKTAAAQAGGRSL